MPRPIGLLGGTFDPVHNGHVVLATLGAEQLGLERLLVVPARRSPHKTDAPTASDDQRLELLRLAFAGIPAIEVSDLELRRPAPSFTVDTVAEIARQIPGRELVLFLGLDSVPAFPRWREAREIARSCRLAVFRRGGPDARVIEDARRDLPGLRIDLLQTPQIEISSTLVRERARNGLSLTGFVPDAVASAIVTMRLYRDR